MIRTALAGLALAGSVAGLSACESYKPTPYQAATRSDRGYSETKIEKNRWRIDFKGNSITSRETVETYMLYRAAELTVQQGFDNFTVVRRDTDKDHRTRSYGGGYWGESLSFSYFVPRRGWVYEYEPYYSPPRYEDVTQYEATAEIIMGKGKKSNDPNAFDAHDVVKNLTSQVIRPPQ